MSPAKNIPTVDLNDYTSGDAAARSRLVEARGPQKRFVSADNPPRHPPITAGAFLEQRLREIGLKA